MTNDHDQSDAHASWIISLAFWLALLAAVTGYASVALAPKLLAHIQLRQDYHAKQIRLVRLEHEVEDLSQVVESLERDPDFVQKLASVDFGARRPGEERIPVDEHLQLSIRDNDPDFEGSVDSLPWYGSLVLPFATKSQLRGSMLLAAATILVGAFVFLQPTQASIEPDSAPAGGGRPAKFFARYRQTD